MPFCLNHTFPVLIRFSMVTFGKLHRILMETLVLRSIGIYKFLYRNLYAKSWGKKSTKCLSTASGVEKMSMTVHTFRTTAAISLSGRTGREGTRVDP